MIKVSAEEGINSDWGHQGGLPGGGGACFRLPRKCKGTRGYKQGVGRRQSMRQRKKGGRSGLLKELAWTEYVGVGIDMGAWRDLQKSDHEGLRKSSLGIWILSCWGWETVKGFNQEPLD